jgi:6-phosphogluconolactonase
VGRIRAALAPLGARIVPLEEGAVPPHFALAWLGMGNDGHIASLFPTPIRAPMRRARSSVYPAPCRPKRRSTVSR